MPTKPVRKTECQCGHYAYLHYPHGRCSVDDCKCVNLTEIERWDKP